jgi:hypothetical protein
MFCIYGLLILLSGIFKCKSVNNNLFYGFSGITMLLSSYFNILSGYVSYVFVLFLMMSGICDMVIYFNMLDKIKFKMDAESNKEK